MGKGGVAARSGERKLILFFDPLLPSVYILLYITYNIYVGPFQTIVWVIPRRKKLEIFFLKTIFFFLEIPPFSPYPPSWVQNTGKVKIRYFCCNLFMTADSSRTISKNLAVEKLLWKTICSSHFHGSLSPLSGSHLMAQIKWACWENPSAFSLEHREVFCLEIGRVLS